MSSVCKNCGQIAAVLQPFVDRGELAGAVTLVADKDSVVRCLDVVGFADLSNKSRCSPKRCSGLPRCQNRSPRRRS